MTDCERILEIQKIDHLNWRELGNKIGCYAQTFQDIRSGRHGISKELAAKILKAYPNISASWLLLGIGEMYDEKRTEDREKLPILTEDDNKQAYVDVRMCFPGAEKAMRYFGDDMVEYPNGSILVLRKVGDLKMLVPGQNYVIRTNEFCVVKSVQSGKTSDNIALYSTNMATYADGRPIHEPFEIPLESVVCAYNILGYIYTPSSVSNF